MARLTLTSFINVFLWTACTAAATCMSSRMASGTVNMMMMMMMMIRRQAANIETFSGDCFRVRTRRKARAQKLFQRLVFMAYLISFLLAIHLVIVYSFLLLSWIYRFVPVLLLHSLALNFSFVHAVISLLLYYNTFLFYWFFFTYFFI